MKEAVHMDYNKRPYFYGTGRRKKSVARVRLYNGTGNVTINGRDINDYFGLETLKVIVRQPLRNVQQRWTPHKTLYIHRHKLHYILR